MNQWPPGGQEGMIRRLRSEREQELRTLADILACCQQTNQLLQAFTAPGGNGAGGGSLTTLQSPAGVILLLEKLGDLLDALVAGRQAQGQYFSHAATVAPGVSESYTLSVDSDSVGLLRDLHWEVLTPRTSQLVLARDGGSVFTDPAMTAVDLAVPLFTLPFSASLQFTFTNNDLIDNWWKVWGVAVWVSDDAWLWIVDKLSLALAQLMR